MVVDFSEEEPNLEPTSVVHTRPSVSVLDAGPPQSNRILSVGWKSFATTSSIANTKHTNNGTQTQHRFMLHITTQNSKPNPNSNSKCFASYHKIGNTSCRELQFTHTQNLKTIKDHKFDAKILYFRKPDQEREVGCRSAQFGPRFYKTSKIQKGEGQWRTRFSVNNRWTMKGVE